jgi:hypothetical protein
MAQAANGVFSRTSYSPHTPPQQPVQANFSSAQAVAARVISESNSTTPKRKLSADSQELPGASPLKMVKLEPTQSPESSGHKPSVPKTAPVNPTVQQQGSLHNGVSLSDEAWRRGKISVSPLPPDMERNNIGPFELPQAATAMLDLLVKATPSDEVDEDWLEDPSLKKTARRLSFTTSPMPQADKVLPFWERGLSPESEGSSDTSLGATAQNGVSTKQTPLVVREMISILGTAPLDQGISPGKKAVLNQGMKELEKLDNTPGSQRKTQKTQSAQKALEQNLTENAEEGTLEYHRKGSSNLKDAAPWVKRELIPSLEGISAMPACAFWNPDHPLTAQMKGKSLIGLHFFPENFSEKFECLAKAENPTTGVLGITYALKIDKENSKFSSMFPLGASFEEVMKLADDADPVAVYDKSRQLISFPLNGKTIHAELYLRENGRVKENIFPIFAFLPYEKGKTYQITKDLLVSAEELLKHAEAALELVIPYLASPASLLRYVIKGGPSADLILDLAPYFAAKTAVPSGVFLRISAAEFAGKPALAKKVQEILEVEE